MQEFPTNKPNFPFKHRQDFNHTTHIASYQSIAFNDDISLYFNYCHYVSKLMETVTIMVTLWWFQHLFEFFNTSWNMFSTHLEIFKTVFKMVHNISKLYFWHFHTFNTRNSLTVMLYSYVGFYIIFWMGSVTTWVQMFQIFKFEMYWKHVENFSTCWKL